MKKGVFIVLLGSLLVLLSLTTSFTTYAMDEVEENPYLNVLPDVQQILENPEGQQEELIQYDGQSLPEKYKIQTIEQGTGTVSPTFTSAYPGNYTYDTQPASYISGANNVIYGEAYRSGYWTNIAYVQFKGYGYTNYNGTRTVNSIKATVKAKATGALPLISNNGSSWSLLSTSRQVASASNTGPKYAQAFYSNVKIQRLTALTAIFTNTSYINVSGLGSETWDEDIWFWF